MDNYGVVTTTYGYDAFGARVLQTGAIENYFFFPVTSSHVSPRSFLITSTFFQASSFI
jgi:hypothetical protein